MTLHAHAEFSGEPFFCDDRGGYTHGRFARGRAPAAAMIADAVLLQIRVVGVRRPERVDEIVVVLGARIGVADQERDRRAGGASFEYAGKDLDVVGFVPLRCVAAFAGRAPIKVGAEIFRGNASPGGQPSTTQPIAGPWLSPKVVTVKSFPKELLDTDRSLLSRRPGETTIAALSRRY